MSLCHVGESPVFGRKRGPQEGGSRYFVVFTRPLRKEERHYLVPGMVNTTIADGVIWGEWHSPKIDAVQRCVL